jgi:hypothetical protein
VIGDAMTAGKSRSCGCLGWEETRQRKYPRLEKRFWDKVQKTDGCWIWTSSRYPRMGYGAFGIGRRTVYAAHRVSYALHHGLSFDFEGHVLHRCDNPPCVNPDHLFLGDHATNMKDMAAKGRGRTGRRTFSDDEARDIWRRLRAGEQQKRIAEQLGVPVSVIHLLSRGKTYRRLHPDYQREGATI